MKKRILVMSIFALMISSFLVFNSSKIASASSLCMQDDKVGSINVFVTFENGNCGNLFTQIKTLSGSVVLQGYTVLNGALNQVSWSTGLPPAGNYVAVVHYSGTTASTQFYWDGSGAKNVDVHFSQYASCGD